MAANVGVPIAASTSFLASMVRLITIEYFTKLKIRYTILRDHINMIVLLYEKTLNKSMKDRKNRSYRIRRTQKKL